MVLAKNTRITRLTEALSEIDPGDFYGRVVAVRGLVISIAGPIGRIPVGGRLRVEAGSRFLTCEVIGLEQGTILAMPFGSVEGIRQGARAYEGSSLPGLRPDPSWLVRVLNGFGEPIDGKGPLTTGGRLMPFRADPPQAHTRRRLGEPLDLGIRVLDTFLTSRRGQRMGIFAGSGVGKSVMLSMIARNAKADCAVIGLIGERGREVQEFIEDDLGPEGLARSVVVVATSDEGPLMRRQAAWTSLSLAEYFRDRDQNVLLMMDSVTRFAMAQREIGLSVGEPPTSKGYTPTVFSELPRLLERAGPGPGEGTITGFFTVLVDGDDHNEPVADAVRGILDGHIVMERSIAERGRYPAVNVLKSISRTLPGSADPAYWPIVQAARASLSTYSDLEELIRLGAYKVGSNAEVDAAIKLFPELENFLRQSKEESTSLRDSYARLASVMASM
jgi:flagellum-specific ATP synthase